MSAALTQLLEILQAHGLMERSGERFLSAQDLVELNEHLALIETEDESEYRHASYATHPQPRSVDDLVQEQRREIADLERRISNVYAALDS